MGRDVFACKTIETKKNFVYGDWNMIFFVQFSTGIRRFIHADVTVSSVSPSPVFQFPYVFVLFKKHNRFVQ